MVMMTTIMYTVTATQFHPKRCVLYFMKDFFYILLNKQSTVLSALQMSAYSIFITALWGKSHSYPCFTGRSTKDVNNMFALTHLLCSS